MPSSDKAAMNIYAGVAPGEDPMQGLQRRMMEKQRQEKIRQMLGKAENQPNPEKLKDEIQVIKLPKKHYNLPGSSPE